MDGKSILIGIAISVAFSIIFYDKFEETSPNNEPILEKRYKNRKEELFRDLYGLRDEYDLVIVGAGLSGSVIAQQASARSGLRILVIDKRDHIG